MLPGVELSDVVRARRMVRSYDPSRPVPLDAVRALLDLAVRAPSAGFSQGWDFVVLHTPAHREAFWAATTTGGSPPDAWLTGMRTAPVLVLCLSDPGRYLDRYAEPGKARAGLDWRDPEQWPVPYWDVDTGMAALLILLGAVDAGLASCFFGVPGDRHDAVRAAFGVPADRRIVGMVSLGHPAADGSARRSPSLRRGRRPQSEVTHDGHFGNPLP
jgi:nitroreductase